MRLNEFGVIFDMDGVLVLTEQAHWESWLVPANAESYHLEPVGDGAELVTVQWGD